MTHPIQSESAPEGGFLVPAVWHRGFYAATDGHLIPEAAYIRIRPPAKPLARRQRLRIRWQGIRERVGFAIAGYTPSAGDW